MEARPKMATSDDTAPDTLRDDDTDTDPDLARVDSEPVRMPARARLDTLLGIGPDEGAAEEDRLPTMPIIAEPAAPTLPSPPSFASSPPKPTSSPPKLTSSPPQLTLSAPKLTKSVPPPPPSRASARPEARRTSLPPPLLPPPASRAPLPSLPALPLPVPNTNDAMASAAAVYRAIAASAHSRPPPPTAPLPVAAGSSVAPVALATIRPPAPPPPPARPPSGPVARRAPARRTIAILGAASGALVALCAFLALRQVDTRGAAALDVKADDGASIGSMRVVIDGVERCTSSPCNVSGLTRGSHLVTVTAPGYLPTTPRALAVKSGEHTKLSFELSRVPQATTTAPTRVAAQSSEPIAPSAALPAAPPVKTLQNRPATIRKAPTAVVKRTKDNLAKGNGILSFVAEPRATVVLDGRPIGKTPIAGMSVPAGTHSVVFVRADGRRKAQTATVAAGSKRSVVAKF